MIDNRISDEGFYGILERLDCLSKKQSNDVLLALCVYLIRDLADNTDQPLEFIDPLLNSTVDTRRDIAIKTGLQVIELTQVDSKGIDAKVAEVVLVAYRSAVGDGTELECQESVIVLIENALQRGLTEECLVQFVLEEIERNCDID